MARARETGESLRMSPVPNDSWTISLGSGAFSRPFLEAWRAVLDLDSLLFPQGDLQ